MGWWSTNPAGDSLLREDTGMYWGDGPADLFDELLAAVDKQFIEAWGRPATKEEILAGLYFSDERFGDDRAAASTARSDADVVDEIGGF